MKRGNPTIARARHCFYDYSFQNQVAHEVSKERNPLSTELEQRRYIFIPGASREQGKVRDDRVWLRTTSKAQIRSHKKVQEESKF